MSLKEAAAALDRLIAEHQKTSTTPYLPLHNSTTPPCFGVTPPAPSSPPATTRISRLKDTQGSEGFNVRSPKVVPHTIATSHYPRHASSYHHQHPPVDSPLHPFHHTAPASLCTPSNPIPSIPVPSTTSFLCTPHSRPIEESPIEVGVYDWCVGVKGCRKGARAFVSLLARPDPTKFKTELCRSYQVHGYCRYGFRCSYAHGLQQLRGAIHHGKYKTRNCKSYHEMGCCLYGARCSFIHDPEEGVLKCSIANKEVLEALHYCPAREETYRTAKITWRLGDSSTSSPPELHFITSNTRPDSHHDTTPPLSATADDHALQEVYNSEDVMSFLPVVSGASSGCRCHVPPSSASWLSNGSRSAWSARPVSRCPWKESRECVNHRPGLCSEGEVEGTQRRPPHAVPEFQVLRRCNRGVWYDAEELLNMKVVQRILREGPHYSPTCWSTTADRGSDTVREHRNFTDGHDCNEIRNVKCGSNYIGRSGSPRGGKDMWSEEAGAMFLERPILCSTLRSESDSEEGNAGICEDWQHTHSHTKDAARKGGHPWLEWPWRDEEGRVWAFASIPGGRYCHDLTKYKTEMCRSFQYNSECEYGDACLYAHGTLDLRSCPRHPMYRTKPCFTFHHKGYCLYGGRCQFMHDLG